MLGPELLADPSALEMGAQLAKFERGPRTQLDVRADPLAEDGVGHRDRRREQHGGVAGDLVFDLGRADVLPTPDDEVGRPPRHREIPGLVDDAPVAGEHPAVGGAERGVRVGVVVVAEAGQRSPARGDPGAAGRGDVVAVVVEQPDLHLGDDPTGGAEPSFPGVGEGRPAQGAGLVGPVELEHRAPGAVLELRGAPLGDHLPAGEEDPEAREVVGRERGCVQQHDELRRDRGEDRHPLAGDEHGTPRSVGVTWAVHPPNPNGAGSTLQKTSSAESSAAATAYSWKASHRR